MTGFSDGWISVVQQIFGLRYYEVRMLPPQVIIPTTTALSITGSYERWVLAYLIRVRSMGTASYVGVGDNLSQDFRLTTIGETFGWSGNPREVFDLGKVYVKSDTSDASLELYVLYKEGQEGREIAVDSQ